MKNKILLNSIYLVTLGILSSFSLPPYNFFWINFFTFSLFFLILFKNLKITQNYKIYFFYGWLFGFGFFVSNIYWISISLTFDKDFKFLIPFTIILIPSFLAVFYGLISYFFFIIKLKKILSSLFLFSLLFGILEYMRGTILTGFPWNLVVYSLNDELNLISVVSVIGSYSLNLIAITIFTLPSIFILKVSKQNIFVGILLALLPFIFLIFGLNYKNNFLNENYNQNPITIRAINSNINIEKFYGDYPAESVIKELIKISNPNKKKEMFFLWPEGIIPNTYNDELYIYKDLFDDKFNENHLIGLGINNKQIKNGKNFYYNSFSIYDYQLNLIDYYNKLKLVPFGEFLPFENILKKIGLRSLTNNYLSYTHGKRRDVIKVDINSSFKFIPLICYEIIYSGLITKTNEFDFVFNISEDGWFGTSIGPKQHFAHSIFRAIETGKYVIRSANNGITAIVNPLGMVEKKLSDGVNGYIDFEQRRIIESTIFSLYGNKIFGIFILLYIFLIISFNRMKNE